MKEDVENIYSEWWWLYARSNYQALIHVVLKIGIFISCTISCTKLCTKPYTNSCTNAWDPARAHGLSGSWARTGTRAPGQAWDQGPTTPTESFGPDRIPGICTWICAGFCAGFRTGFRTGIGLTKWATNGLNWMTLTKWVPRKSFRNVGMYASSLQESCFRWNKGSCRMQRARRGLVYSRTPLIKCLKWKLRKIFN